MVKGTGGSREPGLPRRRQQPSGQGSGVTTELAGNEHEDRSGSPQRRTRPVLVALKGFCMGSADIIPGVSGGTMALILGIYERLLMAIRSFDRAWLAELFRFDFGSSAAFQFGTDLTWIPAIGSQYHIGIDGISLPLLVLSMGPMVGLPIREWLGTGTALWAELLLASPVEF